MNSKNEQPLLSWFTVKGRARRTEIWIKFLISLVLWEIVSLCVFGEAYLEYLDSEDLFFLPFLDEIESTPDFGESIQNFFQGYFIVYLLCLPIEIDLLLTRIRRLHDLEWPGWIVIFFYVTGWCGDIASFIICNFIPGTKGNNQYGIDPRFYNSTSVNHTSSKNGESNQSKITTTYDINNDSEVERKLKELSSLKDKGLITEEEYKELRKKQF